MQFGDFCVEELVGLRGGVEPADTWVTCQHTWELAFWFRQGTKGEGSQVGSESQKILESQTRCVSYMTEVS